MGILRLALLLLLAVALPFQGFAAARLHAGAAPAAHHATASAGVHGVGPMAKRDGGHGNAAASRPMPCCQPALLGTTTTAAAGPARPAQPPFAGTASSSWTEPVPRKPPRS